MTFADSLEAAEATVVADAGVVVREALVCAADGPVVVVVVVVVRVAAVVGLVVATVVLGAEVVATTPSANK